MNADRAKNHNMVILLAKKNLVSSASEQAIYRGGVT